MSQQPNLMIQIEYQHGAVESVRMSPSKKGLQWSFISSNKEPKLETCIDKWFESYLQKEKSSVQVPLALHRLPLFTQQVLRAVEKIPFGTVSTYGQIATLLGRPQAARAVGGACGRNPFLLFVPCHRVLDAKKELRGFSAGGLAVKESLLIFEEADFINS